MSRFVSVVVVAFVLAVGFAVTPAASRPAQAASCVQIYRIYYNSPGTDTRTNTSLNAEWIQLKNLCTSGKSLSSWKIKDLAGHTYTFGTYTLGAGKYVKVHTGSGTNTTTDRYWRSGNYIWNNTGDTAYVRNSAGTLMDSCVYTGATAGYKYC
ncbi:MAG: lamin tail domain-containing protein [Chloroflexota bacterium]